MGKRRGSRFKSRIFRRRKAARLLKASKKKNAPLAILFKLAPFSISWGDREAPFASPRRRDTRDASAEEGGTRGLNHSSSRAPGKHIYPLNSSRKSQHLSRIWKFKRRTSARALYLVILNLRLYVIFFFLSASFQNDILYLTLL